jgi:secondary thiamine-phosphate synthase enzyme
MQYLLELNTEKKEEFIDITHSVEVLVKKSGIKDGICNVYVMHTTASLLLQENEDPNIQHDILEALNEIVPNDRKYRHDSVDGNARSHIKATVLPTNIMIPVKDGTLLLGVYQDLFFCEFDGPRTKRRVVVSIFEDRKHN